jgi:methylated-DNA-protein-cysteine methyltransferase-like protein
MRAPADLMRPAARRRSTRSWEPIYAVVRKIPRGRVATYGQIAALAGFARAPRVAGYALYALPEGTPLPWHRVVGAGGRLSLGRLSPEGALTQRMRLEREGVTFDARGRVQMERHGWRAGAARKKGAPTKRRGSLGR